MNILVLHGPNLNLLGEREPEIYGTTTMDDINSHLSRVAEEKNVFLKTFQTNHEGSLIDHIHTERKWADAIIINPGAFTHYSYSLRDALAAFEKPVYEVHLTDLLSREDFRKVNVFDGLPNVMRIMGRGAESYYSALEELVGRVSNPTK